MWGGDAPRRIFANTKPTDMRKSFQGLLTLVQEVFHEQNPHAGSPFLFVDRRGNYVKALTWDDGAAQLCRGEIAVDSEATVRGTAVRSHERRPRRPAEVPDEKGLGFDVLPDNLSDAPCRLGRLQNPDDLLFRETRSLHPASS